MKFSSTKISLFSVSNNSVIDVKKFFPLNNSKFLVRFLCIFSSSSSFILGTFWSPTISFSSANRSILAAETLEASLLSRLLFLFNPSFLLFNVKGFGLFFLFKSFCDEDKPFFFLFFSENCA